MNYQLLGNSVPHLHVHVVARYLDDPAPGKPLPWEPKVIDESEFDRELQLLTEAARFTPITTPRSGGSPLSTVVKSTVVKSES
jgi:hypothetical protein